MSFPDEDLDLGDLGGELEWTQPEDVSQAGLLLQRARFAGTYREIYGANYRGSSSGIY